MNEVAKQEKSFPAMLVTYQNEIKRALPAHMTPDRICRIALTAFRKNPKLQRVDQISVFASVLQAAQLGLEIGVNGEADLVPFKNECQLIIGYTGFMKLAMNSGLIKDIYAIEVREEDQFSVSYGLNRTLSHVPLAGKGGFPATEKERGMVVGYYAVAIYKDGSATFVTMSDEEVKRIRDNSANYKFAKKMGYSTTWDEHPVEMGKKTAIRRLCKYLPKSAELRKAVSLNDAVEVNNRQGLDVDAALDIDWTPSIEYHPEEAEPEKSLKEVISDKRKAKDKEPVKVYPQTEEKITFPEHVETPTADDGKTPPLSFSPEYKELMDYRVKQPEIYLKAKDDAGIKTPTTIEECKIIIEKIKGFLNYSVSNGQPVEEVF